MRPLLLILVFATLAAPFAMAEKKDDRHTVSIQIQAPNPSYSLRITGVYRVGDEVWAVSQITSRGGIAPAVIADIGDAVTIEPTKLPVKHKVLGKTWNWGDDTDTIEYVPAKEEAALKAKLADAEEIAFERAKKS